MKSCFSGSAPLPVEVLERFEALTGSRIVEGFGLTETSPITHVNPMRTVRKVGSIGIPVPNTDSKVVDLQTGTREMPPGQEGELLIKGYHRIVGRKKDMIIVGGYNVYPDEVDRVLMGHPAVLEAATIGVPDPRLG